nr:hypothetical protein [Tanacetum cinerariifolium]
MEHTLTQLCDIDLMLDDIKISSLVFHPYLPLQIPDIKKLLSLDMLNFFDLLLLELYFAAPSDLKRLMGRVAVMELSKKESGI